MRTPEEIDAASNLLAALVLREVSALDDLEAHLGVPRALLINELESGRLKGIRVGERWLVHRDAVREWLRAPWPTVRGAEDRKRPPQGDQHGGAS